jgi:pimeloyl-ACP methyl ester carboxylesterase
VLWGALCVLGALGAGGCRYREIRTQCPTCTIVARDAEAPPLAADVHTVFLVVPGLLGMAWEWDEPIALLRNVPGAAVEAFAWRPSSSAARAGQDLAEYLERRFDAAPGLSRVVVFGHSAGGLVTARAAALVRVPPGRRLQIVNIGTPYAGMHTTPFENPVDAWWAPATFSIGGVFTRALPVAPRVAVESWITPWPSDPVMKPRFGHHPDDPRVGPPGPRRRAPPGVDHNHFIADVAADVAARVIRAGRGGAIEEPARGPPRTGPPLAGEIAPHPAKR